LTINGHVSRAGDDRRGDIVYGNNLITGSREPASIGSGPGSGNGVVVCTASRGCYINESDGWSRVAVIGSRSSSQGCGSDRVLTINGHVSRAGDDRRGDIVYGNNLITGSREPASIGSGPGSGNGVVVCTASRGCYINESDGWSRVAVIGSRSSSQGCGVIGS